jgi:Phasin protein
MGALMDKVAEITRANAEASFSFALKLTESKETNQAMEMCEEYARKQMEAFAQQFEEIRDLTSQILKDSNLGQLGGISGSIAANSGDPVSKSPPGKGSDAPTLGVSSLQSAVGGQEKRSRETEIEKTQRTDQPSQTADAPAVQTNVMANHSSQITSGEKSALQPPTTGTQFILEPWRAEGLDEPSVDPHGQDYQNKGPSGRRPIGKRKSGGITYRKKMPSPTVRKGNGITTRRKVACELNARSASSIAA